MAAAVRKNWFAIWVTVAVAVVVVVVVIVVVALNSSASGSGAAPEGPNIDSETGAITISEEGTPTDVWFDFYCPHCQEFEAGFGPTITELMDDGDIALSMVPVALQGLNSASGTQFSERSANAAYCVAVDNPDAVYPFITDVFALFPSGEGLTDEQLTTMAADAGASGAASCIADGTYNKFVLSNAQNLPPNPETGSAGTPTLVVDGEYVDVTGLAPADLATRVR